MRIHALHTLTALALLFIGALSASPAMAEQPAPLWSFKPLRGFVDDAMAFSSDDALFAYVHTDSATFIKVVLADARDGFKTLREVDLKDATQVPKELFFSPDEKLLILRWMDGYKGTFGISVMDVAKGEVVKKIGPTTHADVVLLSGKQVLSFTNVKPGAKGEKQHSTELYRAEDIKRVAGFKAQENSDQTIKAPPLRIMYWEPGRHTVVGVRRGAYDKARDIRLPDVGVCYSFLAKKELWAETPKNLTIWETALNMRPNHPDQLRFLEVSRDGEKLLLADAKNDLTELQGQVPWKLYDHESLKQAESWDGGTLYFSLTVNTMNPDAEARKKEDPERADLYALDSAGKLTSLGQVLTGRKRGANRGVKFGWEVGKDHFAYLEKLKGFSRGGGELSIYKKAAK